VLWNNSAIVIIMRLIKRYLFLLYIFLFSASGLLKSQVKITDGSNVTMNPNSLLELESTNKGFLPPRVKIDSLTSPSPLSGSVPAGIIVYSSGGAVTDGYYSWDGSKWKPFSMGPGGVNMVFKTADATLTKADTYVIASNDITLTLPVISGEDNGLSITINNAGSIIDLITILPGGSATINGQNNSKLTRWEGYNYTAYNGNWIIKNYIKHPDDELDVSETSSWQTIPEVLAFLSNHMSAPTVIKLGGEVFSLSGTQTISLPYPVTFEGLSYGVTTIKAQTGFTGGLFSCTTECYFKMLSFESTFGGTGGHDAIRLTGTGVYYEIKDCSFTGFNKGVSITNNCDVWIFESDFDDITVSGIEIAAGTSTDLSFKTSETDFTNCGKGIDLLSGINATISVQNCGFYGSTGGQVGLDYVPTTFTTPASVFFTGNVWNNIGAFISGFDFSRSDGRDANIDIVNNAGIDNKTPKCKINVINNVSTTTLTNSGTWYKANWVNTSGFSVKWNINNNRFTYLPKNPSYIFIIVSGNISVSNANRTITLGIVKNGVTGTRYGETTLRTTTANQAFQYSTTIYIQDVAKSDYFELYVSSLNNGDVVTFQDINIFVNAQ
jgi:hypothetical protein